MKRKICFPILLIAMLGIALVFGIAMGANEAYGLETYNPTAINYGSYTCDGFVDEYYAEAVAIAPLSNRTALGGDRINDARFRQGTIGFNALENVQGGRAGVVTANHIANDYRNMYHGWAGALSPTIGRISMRAPNADAAFAPFNNNWTATPYANSNNPFRIRMGRPEHITVNNQTKQIGAATAALRTGLMQVVNFDLQNWFGYRVRQVFRTTASGGSGDSGGPVFYVSGDTHYLIGMILGGSDDGRRTYAISIFEVVRLLNVTVYCIDIHNLLLNYIPTLM